MALISGSAWAGPQDPSPFDGTRYAPQKALYDFNFAKPLEGKAAYRCTRCGFGARAHHWQCPSCKSWGSVKPIHGVAGD